MKNKSKQYIFIICFIATFLIYGAQGSYTPYISSYYQINGLNKLSIGLISCIGPLVAISIQPMWGIISDKTGKRKLILQILSLSSSLTMILYLINNNPIFLVISSFLYTSFSMAIIPLANAVITKSSRKYFFDYAHVRLGGPLGYSSISLFVSFFIVFNPKSMFVICLIFYLLLFIAISLMPSELFTFKKERIKKDSRKIFDTKEAYLILALAVINTFGVSILNTYIGPKVLDLGYNQSTIGKLTFLMSVCELPVLIFIKRFAKKYSAIVMMNFSVFIAATRLIFAASNSILLIITCQAIEGLSYMVAFYAAVTYISDHCTPGNESKAQTLLVMLESGVGAVLANIVGGFLTNSLGTSTSFYIMALFILITMVIINIARRKGVVTD